MILKMKKRNLLICVLSASVGLASLGCASAPSSNANSSTSQVSEKSAAKNNSYYDDWKYKGFGMPLPQWVQPAIEGKKDKVVKYFPDYSPEQIEIVTSSGINVDNSEDKIERNSERVLIDGFWVRINTQVNKTKEPYITVLIYEKQRAEADLSAQADTQ